MDATQLLQRLTVASPCPVSWDSMEADAIVEGDRARFCGECQKTVYNLSAMTSGEAAELIRGREGRMCALFYRRPDGTIVTQDCAKRRLPVFWDDGEFRPISGPLKATARGFQYSLATLLLLMLACATSLGVVRIIPESWIAATREWLTPQPVAKSNPAAIPQAGQLQQDMGVLLDDFDL